MDRNRVYDRDQLTPFNASIGSSSVLVSAYLTVLVITVMLFMMMMIQKLRESGQRRPSPLTSAAAADLGIDTPGKFLDPATVFLPSFDLQVS